MTTDLQPNKRKSRAISSFLKKTYEILQQPINSPIIKWSQNGIGFVVVKEQQFSKEILPKYFKHSNYSSFVRQLNMYNFHKIRQTNCQSHFHHECFVRDNKALLAEIRRKPQKKKRKYQDQQSDQHQHQIQNLKSKQIIQSKNNLFKNSSNINLSLHLDINFQLNQNTFKIRSQDNTDKKFSLNTHHNLSSQKQNQTIQNNLNSYNNIQGSSIPYSSQLKNQLYQSKQRVSIQNILFGPNSQQNDDDKLSINNQIGQSYPRYPTKQMIYPSSNNIYQIPLVFKGGYVVSQVNLLF